MYKTNEEIINNLHELDKMTYDHWKSLEELEDDELKSNYQEAENYYVSLIKGGKICNPVFLEDPNSYHEIFELYVETKKISYLFPIFKENIEKISLHQLDELASESLVEAIKKFTKNDIKLDMIGKEEYAILESFNKFFASIFKANFEKELLVLEERNILDNKPAAFFLDKNLIASLDQSELDIYYMLKGLEVSFERYDDNEEDLEESCNKLINKGESDEPLLLKDNSLRRQVASKLKADWFYLIGIALKQNGDYVGLKELYSKALEGLNYTLDNFKEKDIRWDEYSEQNENPIISSLIDFETHQFCTRLSELVDKRLKKYVKKVKKQR